MHTVSRHRGLHHDHKRAESISQEIIFILLPFIFQLADGSPELLETPYSAMLEQFINLHLKFQHSIPVFLSAITVDVFGHQTV
jgi:hypothetical protein